MDVSRKIYAVEVDKLRYQNLCTEIEVTGASCVETVNKDALALKPDEYPNVEYILVDPTCSGSGRILLHGYQRARIFSRGYFINKFFCYRYVGQTESVWQREIRQAAP